MITQLYIFLLLTAIFILFVLVLLFSLISYAARIQIKGSEQWKD